MNPSSVAGTRLIEVGAWRRDPLRFAAAPFWMLADLGLCSVARWWGAPPGMGHGASFLMIALLVGGLQVWRVAASGRRGALAGLLLVTGALTLCVRGAMFDVAVQVWHWPWYAAVLPAAGITAVAMQAGRQLALDLNWRTAITVLVGYAVCLRLTDGALLELLPEEAYYWNYSRHLDIGYLDHPPLVAWLIRAGTAAFGDSQFGVRAGALCCGMVAGLYIFRLTRNLFGDTAALLALALSQLLPYFFLSGMLMTPDAPLTAAWAASLYFLERALIAGQGRAWLWAGLALGAGLLSKYTIAMLGGAAFVFMLLDPPARRWFRRWEPYAAVFIAAAVFAPVLVWNAEHDWASFVFQTSRRLAEVPRFSLHKLVGAAVVLLTPVGLLAVGHVLRGGPSRSLPEPVRGPLLRSWRLLRLAVLLPVAVFVVFSLRHEVKLDWTGAPWTAALPLLGIAFVAGRPAKPRFAMAWPATIVGVLLLYGAGFYHLIDGIPGVPFSSHMELLPVEWRDFGRQIDELAATVRKQYGDDVLVVGMDRYAIASEIAFYSRDQTKAVAATSSWHLFGNMGLMYERWFPVDRQIGQTLLLVAMDPASLAAGHLERHVAALGPLEQAWLVRDGKPVRPYFYRVAQGYRHAASG